MIDREDIIRMAREADEHADKAWPLRPRCDKWKSCRDAHFAALVDAAAVASEREACAKVCEQVIERIHHQRMFGRIAPLVRITAAIRERSSDLRARGQQ